jgi:signal peptidase II
MRILFWTSFWIFLSDQVSKYLILHVLKLDAPGVSPVSVIPGFIEFRMAWNRGVNFGLFADFDMKWVLIAVATAITFGVLVWLWRSGTTKLGYIAGGFLVGGALGNVIDRVLYDAVADFLNVTCCGINNPYAFNIADIAIFIGAIGLAFIPENAEPKPKRKKAS